ncbi:Crp/Fnr family transcriptional regulator [Mucilaginibacter ginsenosidivorans]|uniref:Crp/Fnr family transcriptional regulator n=1 Tax=Mucilaginibacter ginsenosidivorans TaxID=398053 RepID=A0A5B8US41_9SPHI|nr:Crp/Fnr family transcriptional regulator [Mucilaginibacter ginsenosidivorans]QEC61880.1 Crp/Fnr family transcriptional regulator [Mucilaginibacter ginsenosidivorans]
MKNNQHGCDLNSCMICRLCLKDWLPAIEANKQNFYIKKGQQIFREGDPVKGMYFIYSGTVKVHKKWDKEKELIIRFAKKGDILGHMGLGDEAIYPVTTTALEPTIVCYVKMDFFESTLKVNNELTYRLMRFFAGGLQDSEKRMRNLVHMPVKGRIAQSLIALKTQFGINDEGAINIELTRQDLSSFAGASYETLFKVINELVDEKIAEVSGKSIRILDEPALKLLTRVADM